MSELVYRKGEGWVYDNVPRATEELGIWRITVEQREPLPGERFQFGIEKNPQDFLLANYKWWNWMSGTLPGALSRDYAKLEHVKVSYPNRTIFTVIMERIK